MQKLKVMLVEDEALERMLLRRFVEAEPDVYEVVREAAFAQEALEYLDEHAVDIVVTDINMPVMDGLRCTAARPPCARRTHSGRTSRASRPWRQR